jgi:hypothetical protein
MKNFLKISFLASALVFSGTLAAQEFEKSHSDFLFHYDTELFQWSYSSFGGLALSFQNQSSLTSFGMLKEPMKNALLQYEDVNKKYRAFKGKALAGRVLMLTGLAAILAGAYIPILGSWRDGSLDNNLRIGLGVGLGGLVTGIIGTVIFNAGQENIFDAVNIYNRHKIQELQ